MSFSYGLAVEPLLKNGAYILGALIIGIIFPVIGANDVFTNYMIWLAALMVPAFLASYPIASLILILAKAIVEDEAYIFARGPFMAYLCIIGLCLLILNDLHKTILLREYPPLLTLFTILFVLAGLVTRS